MGLIVFIIAVLLGFVLIPIGFFWSVIKTFYNTGFKSGIKEINGFFWDCAVSIDQTANVLCQKFFNDTLIENVGYQFGNPDETISGVLGKNKLKGTLTKTGKVLDWILEKLERNHTISSIEEDENYGLNKRI